MARNSSRWSGNAQKFWHPKKGELQDLYDEINF